MKAKSIMLAVLVAAALAVPVALSGHDGEPGSTPQSGANAVSHTLANGLTLIVVQKATPGLFDGLVGCLGGSAFDPAGGSGTAHLTEHLMADIMIGAIGPPAELRRALAEEYGRTRGADSPRSKALEAEIDKAKGRGDWNIGTTADLVYYGVQSDPSEWLERFVTAGAQILERDPPEIAMQAQKQSLINEVKKRVAGDERGQVTSPHLTTVFPPDHPYGAPVGARLADVERMTIQSVRTFKATYYQPARCAVVVVGDVRPAEFFKTAEAHFASVPSGTPPSIVRPNRPKGERRATIESPAGPSVHVTFLKPSIPTRDDSIADVIAALMGGGEGSRLSTQLVGARLATKAYAGNGGPGHVYDNMLSFHATLASGHRAEDAEAAMLREIERLKTVPVGDAELHAAIERLAANTENFYEDSWAFVLGLLRYQLIAGDWRAMATAREACRSVTADEIMAFARTYFTADNRTVLYLTRRG